MPKSVCMCVSPASTFDIVLSTGIFSISFFMPSCSVGYMIEKSRGDGTLAHFRVRHDQNGLRRTDLPFHFQIFP